MIMFILVGWKQDPPYPLPEKQNKDKQAKKQQKNKQKNPPCNNQKK